MKIFDDVTQLTGSTPLVRIRRICGDNATVLAKLETYNPLSSVKDRIAVAIVAAAEASGALQPGGRIVEATSGNTGIGLAMVGAARGYQVTLAMPESMSMERRQLLQALGAELVLTPASEGMRGAVAKADEIAQQDNTVLAHQFANPANPDIHRRTTAVEIWDDTEGSVDIFIAGIGTGGTITGVGQILKQRNPAIQIIAVEPKDSPLLTEGKAGPHKIQGIGANFVPDILDQGIIDEVIDIGTEEAKTFARSCAKQEAILVGISSGAALAAATIVAQRAENAGKTIVVILPSTGERELSTELFSQ